MSEGRQQQTDRRMLEGSQQQTDRMMIEGRQQQTDKLSLGLLTGGYRKSDEDCCRTSGSTAVVVVGGDCQVAELPERRSLHVSFVTPSPDPLVLVCGGANSKGHRESSCLSYDLTSYRWLAHSNLTTRRRDAVGVTLQGGGRPGSYVLGGNYARGSDFLPHGSREWQEGPPLPTGDYLEGACAVAVGPTSFLLLGGKDPSTATKSDKIHQYSSEDGSWTTWTSTLITARHLHACQKLGNKVIVAGGKIDQIPQTPLEVSRSSVVLDLDTQTVRMAGDMARGRFGFGMFRVGFTGREILLTFGSQRFVNFDAGSLLQQWSPEDETWLASPAVQEHASFFSALTVEADLICKKGNGDLGVLHSSLVMNEALEV